MIYKKIYQFDKQGYFIKEWQSVSAIVKAGYNKKGVYKCLANMYKSSGGYIWTQKLIYI